jgi:hypothetical protein
VIGQVQQYCVQFVGFAKALRVDALCALANFTVRIRIGNRYFAPHDGFASNLGHEAGYPVILITTLGMSPTSLRAFGPWKTLRNGWLTSDWKEATTLRRALPLRINWQMRSNPSPVPSGKTRPEGISTRWCTICASGSLLVGNCAELAFIEGTTTLPSIREPSSWRVFVVNTS